MAKRKVDSDELQEPVEETAAPVEVTLDPRSKLSAADKVRWLEQNTQGGK